MKKNDWKKRKGVVYSTNSDFSFQHAASAEVETIPASKQNLKVFLDNRGRAGKQMTVVSGFVGTTADIETLTKALKTKCGAGGSAKDGEILIQGDVRDKLVLILSQLCYKVRRSG